MSDFIGPARVDHIKPSRSAEFPVSCIPKGDGPIEYVTVEYALNRVLGYNTDEPEGTIERDLRAGVPFQTMSFIYRIFDE